MPTYTKAMSSKARMVLVVTQTSQSVANNTSNVRATMYIEVDKTWFISGSYGNTTASVTVNGSTQTHTATPSMRNVNAKSAKVRKQLFYKDFKNIKHNADGKKSISISAKLPMSLDGHYFTPPGGSSVKSASYSVSGTMTLSTIPRESTISNGWSANIMSSTISIPIKRAASSFTHTVDLYVGGSKIYTSAKASDHTSSTSIKLTAAERSLALSKFSTTATTASAEVRYNTWSGSTKISSSTKTATGKVTRPATSTVSASGVSTSGSGKITISNRSTSYTYTARVYAGKTLIKTISGLSSNSTTYSFTSAEKNKILGLMKTSSSMSGKVELDTIYSGRVLRTHSGSMTISKSASDTIGNFGSINLLTYRSKNSILGSTARLIQSKSIPIITIGSNFLPLAAPGASINKVIVTLGSRSITLTGSNIPARSTAKDVEFTAADISNSGNVTLRVQAFDTYGNNRSASRSIPIIGYDPPTILVNAERFNGYEDETSIEVSVQFSSVQEANSVSSLTGTIRQNVSGASSSNLGTFIRSAKKSNIWEYSPIIKTLDNTKEWVITLTAKDALGTITTRNINIGKGKPVFVLDGERSNVSINSSGLSNTEPNFDLKIGELTDSSASLGQLYLRSSHIGNEHKRILSTSGSYIWFNEKIMLSTNYTDSSGKMNFRGQYNMFYVDSQGDYLPIAAEIESRFNSSYFKYPNFSNGFGTYYRNNDLDSNYRLRFFKNADGMVHFQGKLSRVDSSGKSINMYHDLNNGSKWTHITPDSVNFPGLTWPGRVAFRLPVGYRPDDRINFIIQSKRIDIFPNGNVVLASNRYGTTHTEDWLGMNFVSFRAHM